MIKLCNNYATSFHPLVWIYLDIKMYLDIFTLKIVIVVVKKNYYATLSHIMSSVAMGRELRCARFFSRIPDI
jgi:hypothetical protein